MPTRWRGIRDSGPSDWASRDSTALDHRHESAAGGSCLGFDGLKQHVQQCRQHVQQCRHQTGRHFPCTCAAFFEWKKFSNEVEKGLFVWDKLFQRLVSLTDVLSRAKRSLKCPGEVRCAFHLLKSLLMTCRSTARRNCDSDQEQRRLSPNTQDMFSSPLSGTPGASTRVFSVHAGDATFASFVITFCLSTQSPVLSWSPSAG